MKQLYTKWGESLDKNNILKDYPRPQMIRNSYLNLNGYWNYAINKDANYQGIDGKILIPFSPESILSEVNRVLKPDEYLIYQKEIILPEGFLEDGLILHFGAVDQECQIFVDDVLVYEHLGGFTPFSVDIKDNIKDKKFLLKVLVKDITDTSYRQTGKQRLKRGGIFYTPQSGIWQTVWLESVPKNYIVDYVLTINFDQSLVKFDFESKQKVSQGHIKIIFNNKLILEQDFNTNSIELYINHKKAWSPEHPHLYEYEISFDDDNIKGYFGMRKFERKADSKGIMHFYLNNEPYFLSGVLDQGYYPDGLLTPPSDEAMIFDIQTMKDYGFNFIRKHIKIEPLRWYYHCDRLGMIVWQDMINGSTSKDVKTYHILSMINININDKYYRLFGRKHLEGRIQFMNELDELLNHLKNITSISTWVPFNEAWGQFDSLKVENHVRSIDPSRLIDHASGWSDRKGGDYRSRHIYFGKIKLSRKEAKKRILALTEFGGYSYRIDNHSYNLGDIFGYKIFNTKIELDQSVKKLYENQIYPNIDRGLNVLVYTQVTDVEDEVNGFITYDRKEEKISKEMMKEINHELFMKFDEHFR